jgi:hypothetical protein
MTSVISLRLPAALDRAIRGNATNSRMRVADIVRLILEHSIGGQYSFSELRDVPLSLDSKLDVRLPQEIVAKLRAESQRLNISISVYSRVILYAYYTKRLVFVEIGGRYTLAENHDQKKSA